MRTEELIEQLVADRRAVEGFAARRRFGMAALCGTALSTAIMLSVLGVRPDFAVASEQLVFWIKLGMPLCVAAAALHAAARLAHPGMRAGRMLLVPAACLLLLWAASAKVVLAADPASRARLLLGDSWAACVAGIALLALPAFTMMMWALKGFAPTRLTYTGASIGLFSGGVGAAVYSFYCMEMQIPFIAVWNVIGILIPTAAGAWLGPRALRW